MPEPKNDNYKHSLNFGFSSNKTFFQKSARTFEKRFYMLLTVLGTASFTYAGGFVSNAKTFWALTEGSALFDAHGFWDSAWVILSHPAPHFLYATFMLGWGLSGSSKDYENLLNRNKELEKKEDENNKLKADIESSEVENATLNGLMKAKHAQLVETWLNGAFSQLLGKNTKARVSIYYYYDGSFYMLARFSPNGRLKEIHKQKFSPTQGVIQSVYEDLICHEFKAPEYKKSTEAYDSYMIENYGYEKEQLKSFNMKSCRYFGEAIREADSVIGIILYESEDPKDLLKPSLIQDIENYHKNYWSHLCQFVRQGLEHDLSTKHHENSVNDKDILAELGANDE
ncbi:hypothetical protein DXJ58_18045 [Vibrio fluvialis]|nr:hypothetical protein [Vibrio fluvialis]EKO4002127.1 hypothetical protein [Vibrio fluvialis]